VSAVSVECRYGASVGLPALLRACLQEVRVAHRADTQPELCKLTNLFHLAGGHAGFGHILFEMVKKYQKRENKSRKKDCAYHTILFAISFSGIGKTECYNMFC